MSSASDKPEMEPITEEVEISANFSDSWTENLTAPEKTWNATRFLVSYI